MTFATNTRARAREADDGGKDEDCGRLAAWAGLDLGDDIAGEVLRCPAQARNVSTGESHSFFEARHDQGLEGDRAAVGAAVFELLLVAIFLRSHLADQPFARIDLQPTMFDHIGFGRFDSRIIPFTSAYGLSALLRSIGDLMDFVE